MLVQEGCFSLSKKRRWAKYESFFLVCFVPRPCYLAKKKKKKQNRASCFDLYELWTHPSHLSTSFCPRAWFQVILISQAWPRTCSRVHLIIAVVNFFDRFLLYIFSCRVWDFRPALPTCRCFWRFESSFFTVLAIVTHRLLYVSDYVVGSLNSSFIWSLSLQLVEYNSQHLLHSEPSRSKGDLAFFAAVFRLSLLCGEGRA